MVSEEGVGADVWGGAVSEEYSAVVVGGAGFVEEAAEVDSA